MTNLTLYNSLTCAKEVFVPLKEKEVSLYVCGITPDAASHLGHAFTYLSFDILVRLLTYQGYAVRYLQNVTDIDDDILVRSNKAGQNWREFGEHWTQVFLTNMENLGWIKPDPYVKATDSIPTIVKIVSTLVEKGFAYEVDGTVYFEVKKFENYGKLSKFSEKEMIQFSRERGADPDDPNKRNPLDFILWQKAKPEEPEWDSPWVRPQRQGDSDGGRGKGRPGWHIECSSMIFDNLGEQIDIHGGGEDLIFPHHESEIAQSESFTGKVPFVKYFMHTGSVLYHGEKMSKSLGNLVLTSDLLSKYSANAIRFLLLSHHYRQPWEYREEDMEKAARRFEALSDVIARNEVTRQSQEIATDSLNPRDDMDEKFLEILNNDLSTPLALNYLLKEKPKGLKNCLKLLGFV